MNMTPFFKFYFGHTMLIIITSYLKIYANSTEVNITSESDFTSESSFNNQNVTFIVPKMTKLTDTSNKPTVFTKNTTMSSTSSVSVSSTLQREFSNSVKNTPTTNMTKVPKNSKLLSMNSANTPNDSYNKLKNITVMKNNSGELSSNKSSVYGKPQILDKNKSSENFANKEVTTTPNKHSTASTFKRNYITSGSLSSALNGYSLESITSASISPTMVTQETVNLENTPDVSGKSDFNNHTTVIENLNGIETTDKQTAAQSSRTTNPVPQTSTTQKERTSVTSGIVSGKIDLRHYTTVNGNLNGVETTNDQTAAQMSKTTISLPPTSTVSAYKEQNDFASGNLSLASNETSVANTTSPSTARITKELVNIEYTTNISGKGELHNDSYNDINLNDIEITNDQSTGKMSGTTILLPTTPSEENSRTTTSVTVSSETPISTETHIYGTNKIAGHTGENKPLESSTFPTKSTKIESSSSYISSTEPVQVKKTKYSDFTVGYTKLEPQKSNSVSPYEKLDTTTLQMNNATELFLSRTRQLKTDDPTVIQKITKNILKVTSLKEDDGQEKTTRNYLTGKQMLSNDQGLTTKSVGRTYSKQPSTTSGFSTKDQNTTFNFGTTGNQLTSNRVNVMKTTPSDIKLTTTTSERQHDGNTTKNDISHTTKITAAESSHTEMEYEISNSSDDPRLVSKSPTTPDFGSLYHSTQSSGHNRSTGVQSYISESSKTSLTPEFKDRTENYQQVSTGNSSQEIDVQPQRIADGDDTYWPIAVAVTVGVPVIIVIGVTIIVLHRKRKLEKAHSIALQGYIAAPREYYA